MYAGEKHEVTIVSDIPTKKEIERMLSSEDFRLYLYGKVYSEMFFKTQVTVPDIAVFE